jgi:hypothetical protein
LQRGRYFETHVEGALAAGCFTAASNSENAKPCARFVASWLIMVVPPFVVCENDGIVKVFGGAAAPPLMNILFLFLFRRLPKKLLRELSLDFERLLRNLRENLLLDDIFDIRFDILIFLLFFIFDFDDAPPLFDTLISLCWKLFLSMPLLTAVRPGLASVTG